MLTRLGLAVLLERKELLTLVYSAPHRYKVYQIEKRTRGQYRTIAQPAREVKALQYWVMKHVLNQFDVHKSATAYRKRTSILHNAKPHTTGRYLLKMDFRDFFPSLKARDFRLLLERHPSQFDAEDISALSSILFWLPKKSVVPELCLSIGAPSSPMLSNILMFQFDTRIAAFCKENDVVYTRYADDISFSSSSSANLAATESAVVALCAQLQSPSLTLNGSKTVRVSMREARRITGLVLTNDRKVSIGRDAKRRLRAAMHHFAIGRMQEEEIPHLRGMLAYVNSVEPMFIRRLRKKYGSDVVQRCLSWITGASGS